ncbi:hypothetical protein [Hymenobacter sp. BT190]|uniref:hypothetical protein n=1 Tax=Hymenobacter sp. BT190 TaxID=2763505 RepID=UPI00165199BD|nr:hypothetical protein [Hymenobacter sp. BT190]MBC6698068.1 hypothetical protein [Hymenobacter sp. BT190]
MAELTKAQLEEQLAVEKVARATAESNLAAAEQAQRDAVAELAEVRQQLKESHENVRQLEAENGTLESRAIDAEGLNEQLAEELANVGSNKPATVKLAEREFEVTAGKFKFQGKSYTREDVKSNSDVLSDLVAAGAGILKEVTA